MRVGYDSYGRRMTMNLFAEKEHFDVLNLTLYQVSWTVAPIENDIKFTVCLNGCTDDCLYVVKDEKVDAGEVESGFETKYRNETSTSNRIAICYYEEDDQGTKRRYEFVQPIVYEDYSSSDDPSARTYDVSGEDDDDYDEDSTVPDGAEKW
jgi:hypothetical protein